MSEGPTRVALRGLPSVWASYPFVVLRKRAPAEETGALPELVATVTGVRIDRSRLERYARVCGFAAGEAAVLIYPHVLAMPLHLYIFAMPQFRLRPMGLIHLSNEIELLEPADSLVNAPLDIEVVARNFTRDNLGVRFDVATEIRAGRSAGLARELRVPVAIQQARRECRSSATTAQGAEGRTGARRVRAGSAHGLGLRARLHRFQPDPPERSHGAASRPARRDRARPLVPRAECRRRAGLPIRCRGCASIRNSCRRCSSRRESRSRNGTEPGVTRRALCDTRTGRVHMYAGLRAPATVDDRGAA